MTLDTGVSFATAYASGYAALLIQYFKENNIPYDQEKIIEELSGDLETHM